MTMKEFVPHIHSDLQNDNAPWPVLIGLLGNFRLFQAGQPMAIYSGGKIEALLSYLGLQHGRRVVRDTLLSLIWPTTKPEQARRSLNTLISNLNKLLGPALHGAAPVVHEEGYYRLNTEAGVAVDIDCFDAFVREGDQRTRAGDDEAGIACYRRALHLYRGDLNVTPDIHAVVERERLRKSYLMLLARMADYSYRTADYATCLEYTWRLLASDPCREDAHRMVMRCYVQFGQRAEALHHYHICADILRAEFDTAPEEATTALFERIRHDLGGI